MRTALFVATLYALLTCLLSSAYSRGLGWENLKTERDGDWYLGHAQMLVNEGRYQDCLPEPDAESIACATPLPMRAYRLPGYPIFLAGVLKIWPEHPVAVVRLLQAMLTAMITLLATMAAYRLKPHRITLHATGLLMAFSSELLYHSGHIYTETLFTWALLIYFWLHIQRRNEFGLGLWWGFTLLIRSSMILATPLLILTLPRRRAVVYFLSGMGLMIGGWAVRNFVILDAFVPLSTNGGAVLKAGNNPVSIEHGGPTNPPLLADWGKFADLDEAAQDTALRESAVRYLRTQSPTALAKVAVLKIANLAGYGSRAGNGWSPSIAPLPLVLLLAIAVLRKRVDWQFLRGREVQLMLIFFAATLLNTLIFFGSTRFRTPIVPYLIICTGVLGATFWDEWQKRPHR